MSTRVLAALALCLVFLSPSQAQAAKTADDAQAKQVGTVTGRAAVTAGTDCDDFHTASAFVGGWRVSTSPCAIFGSPGRRVGYNWSVSPISEGVICVQGLGYRFSAQTHRRVAKWYPLGCGKNNDYCTSPTNCTYPWGNATAYPKVRAKVMPGTLLGAVYQWKH
jgi:hypothetical protein